MKPNKTSDYPQELWYALEDYNHGLISRRDFLARARNITVGGLTGLALLDSLSPNYAWGQQVPPDDNRLTTEYATAPSPEGNGSIRGYLARPASTTGELPGVIVVHGASSLNPHIEDVVRRLATENFMAFAPDALTTVGGYPGDDYQGGQLFRGIDGDKMTADFVAAARWLKSRPDCNGRIAATGFCFGGGMSNTLAVLLGSDLAAAAPFYGRGPAIEDVPQIRAAMLIHHGALDTRLVQAYPDYEAAMQANNVTHEGHIYPDSVHGFFNDATPERYNQATAEEAWTRTIAWFNRHTREAA